MIDLRAKRPSVEAAWRAYRDLMLGPKVPDAVTTMSRLAFWAGASVLFYAIMHSMDPGIEPTEADLSKMDALHAEIDRFCSTFDAVDYGTEGHTAPLQAAVTIEAARALRNVMSYDTGSTLGKIYKVPLWPNVRPTTWQIKPEPDDEPEPAAE